jgi:PAS domain S-box-containing protein
MYSIDSPLFQALFNTQVPRIVLKADVPNFTILTYNEAYKLATHTQTRDIKGKYLWEAFNPANAGGDGGELLLNALTQAVLTNSAVQMPPFHYDIPSADGNWMEKSWWQMEILPVEASDGKVAYLLTTMYNVTEQIITKQLVAKSREREQQFDEELASINEELSASNEELTVTVEELRHAQEELLAVNEQLEETVAIRTKALDDKIRELSFLADSIPSIVWTSDPDGKLDYINHRWYERNPNSASLPLGNSWLANLHPDDIDRVKGAWKESIETGNAYEIEFRILNRNSDYQWYLVRALPLRDDTGKIIKWYGNNTDIQQQKTLQQQKDDFISIASHELKTPITALKASLQLLDKIKHDSASNMFSRLIMQSRKSSEKISALVDDLLNVRRLEEGQLSLKKNTFVLSELINAICNPITIGGKHKVEIDGNKVLRVYADEHRIDQVITNFVNNAVKYAPDSETIVISIKRAGEMAYVSVSDKGQGIPFEKIPHIFDRFFRADHSGDQYSGLGLGLYISSEIIKRHDGQIGVESKEGVGSTFWFTIPIGAVDTLDI